MEDDKVKPDDEIKTPPGRWIQDTWGTQGWIWFDCGYYWLTRIIKETGKVYSQRLSPKEFEERCKGLEARSRERKKEKVEDVERGKVSRTVRASSPKRKLPKRR